MKMVYEKPTIAVEYYQLTQSIAACQTVICALGSVCVLIDPDSTDGMRQLAGSGWFSDGYCTNAANGMSEEDGICYHTSINAAFTSST